MEHIRFTSAVTRPDADNLFRTRNLASQVSIYGAVADWCDELPQQIPGQLSSSIEKSTAKVNEQLDCPLLPEEVNTLMKTPETDVQASRNRLRDDQEKFEHLTKEMKVTQTCETTGFMRKVALAQCFRTIHDIDDGFGGETGAHREYTPPRDHGDSEPVA